MDLVAITDAVGKMLDPLTPNNIRAKCIQLTEDYKEHDFCINHLQSFCDENQSAPAVIFGLRCLEHRVKRSWAELAASEKLAIKEMVCICVSNLHKLNSYNAEGNAISLVLTQILVHIIKCEWPQQWPSMIEEFSSLGHSGEAYFEPEAVRMIRAALQFLSGFFEWAPIVSFMDWKPPKDFPFTMQTVPSVYLMLSLLRVNAFKVEVADLLSVLIVKKRSLFTGAKDVETTSVYSAFIAFSEDPASDPVTFLHDTTRITYSIEQYTQESGVFLQRWTEFLVFLGVQVVENWSEILAKQPNAQSRVQGTFELLFHAVLLTASHPTRIASAQASKFFKSVLESSSPSLLECISKYMPQLLELWSEHCILVRLSVSRQSLLYICQGKKTC
ncbi:unnamed protein product [Dibothriocephalus latus]|uniref:Importin N-terminal domain-containing protein n=1 Tax=Dibothriocephalus latus TaxID=60516 RepID=A0A3P7MT75_DIBLA|nr:unnamed protein product [Dibothriocephalus latus]